MVRPPPIDKAIRFPDREQGNPLFPLPPDYDSLSEVGKHLARLNACCLGHKSPEDFVVSWDFFRRTYLWPTPPGSFYGDDLVESPAFHYQMVYSMADNQFNAWACPRGFGKSTLMDELQLLLVLSRPGFPVGLCLASDDLVTERFGIYQKQFTDNEFIQQDFGELRPTKGEGKFNEHLLALRNGSRMRGFAVLGRKRGTKPRPRLLILDDPEYDPSGSTDTTKLRLDFEWLLFRVLMNMGQKGMNMFWPGTMITKRGMLWHAFSGEDARFEKWHRQLVQDTSVATDGKTVPTWKEMWNDRAIQAKIEEIGWAAYSAEYRNNPGESEESTFRVHPDLNTYTVEGDTQSNPLSSTAVLRYKSKSKGGDILERVASYGEFTRKLFRVALMDYAPTVSVHSDYSAIVMLGFESPGDVLWVLDCWVGRATEDTLIRKLYAMGRIWQPRIVGIEAVSIQKRVADMASEFFEERAVEGTWHPRIFPITYARQISKQDRIAGMGWRFGAFKIKLPIFLRQTNAGIRVLLEQIEGFQAQARDGNLKNDDAVDALSMYQEVHRAGGVAQQAEDSRPLTPADKLAAGELIDRRTGIPVLTGMNASEIPLDVALRLVLEAYDNKPRRSLVMGHSGGMKSLVSHAKGQ